jgi:hypothetical protein
VLSKLIDAVRLLLRPEWTRERRTDEVRPGKVVVDNTEPVVVFLLGIRINRWRGIRHWLPLVLTIPSMLRELASAPEGGLLGYRVLLGPGPRQAMLVQYWRRAEDLHSFARDGAGPHRAAQHRYWWHYGSSASVGVWHEMLIAAEGAHHAMYGNMPPMGLGALRPVRDAQWWARPQPDRVSGP